MQLFKKHDLIRQCIRNLLDLLLSTFQPEKKKKQNCDLNNQFSQPDQFNTVHIVFKAEHIQSLQMPKKIQRSAPTIFKTEKNPQT